MLNADSVDIRPHHELIYLKESYVLHKTKSDDSIIRKQLVNMNNKLLQSEKQLNDVKNNLSQSEKQLIDLNNRLLQLEKCSDKPKDYSKYKNLFSHPSSEKITINCSMYEKFKLSFTQHDALHQFLVDIDYDPPLIIYMTKAFKIIFVRNYDNYIKNDIIIHVELYMF